MAPSVGGHAIRSVIHVGVLPLSPLVGPPGAFLGPPSRNLRGGLHARPCPESCPAAHRASGLPPG
eukprot:8431699-Pyramimonas_sp.AAC.1